MIPLTRIFEMTRQDLRRWPNVLKMLKSSCSYWHRNEREIDEFLQTLDTDYTSEEKLLSQMEKKGLRFFTRGSGPVKQDKKTGAYSIDFANGEWPASGEEVYYGLFIEPPSKIDEQGFKDCLGEDFDSMTSTWWSGYEKLWKELLKPWYDFLNKKHRAEKAPN